MMTLARPPLMPLLVPTYEPGCRCPSCRKRNWYIGRFTAECAFCTLPMQLPETSHGK